MKNLVWLVCLLLLVSCKKQIEVNSAVDKEALMALVTDETLAYMAKDYEKWASFWDHGNEVLRLDVANTGFSQTRGWEKNGAHLENFFKEHPEPITSTFENTNYLIFSDSNLAWVAFDQLWTTEEGAESTAKATVTLVKKGDAWKIISYTAIQYDAKDGDADTLERE